jgi:hypothetical protein
MEKEIKLLEEHCEFIGPNDAYVILAVSRKKDTLEITNSKEIIFREVIKRKEDIKRKYLLISSMCKAYRDEEGKAYPFYIYISLNARDALKATFGLINKINLWNEETLRGVDRSSFYKKVHGHFYSTLMDRQCRSKNTKYSMFDIDTKDSDKIKHIEKQIGGLVEVVMRVETRHGYHYKVKPFNSENVNSLLADNNYKDIISLKRDCLMFVEYVSNMDIPIFARVGNMDIPIFAKVGNN